MALIQTGKAALRARQQRINEGNLFDNNPHAYYDSPEDSGLLDGPAFDPRDEG